MTAVTGHFTEDVRTQALSAMAMLFSEVPEARDEFMRSGGDDKLMGMLKEKTISPSLSSRITQVLAAMLENPPAPGTRGLPEFLELNGGIPIFSKLLALREPVLLLPTARTLRHACSSSPGCARDFIKCGGVLALVKACQVNLAFYQLRI